MVNESVFITQLPVVAFFQYTDLSTLSIDYALMIRGNRRLQDMTECASFGRIAFANYHPL